MKKTLIALAAVAATSAAFAQSSVTLYGVADVSVGAVSDPGLGLANDDFQVISGSTLNNGTSRWGVRGVEDLGGGLKAGFNFEQGVDLRDGAVSKAGAGEFGRAANLSLMGGFGEVRLGRSLSTSYYSVASWELTGTANYSAVANQFGFAGAGSRNSAAIMYFSPNMGGFTVGASTVLEGNQPVAVPPALQLGAKYDLSLGYANGPLVASFAYNTQENGVEGYALGAKYNFGAFVIAGSYQNSENEATGVTRAEGFTIGGTANLGPVALTLDIARDTEFEDTDWVLEAKYPLSKRTFVYAVAMRDGKGKTSATNNPTGAINVTGYAVGIRHNF